jgi:hypothetical protein
LLGGAFELDQRRASDGGGHTIGEMHGNSASRVLGLDLAVA